MTNVPAHAFEIPDYSLWILFGWIFTGLISYAVGYRLGRRAQKEGAKLNARIAALAIVDRTIADLAKPKTLVDFFSKSKAELKTVIFGFSCQLGTAKRLETEKAWNDYQQIPVNERSPFPGMIAIPPIKFDPQKVEEERKKMRAALICLRNIIGEA